MVWVKCVFVTNKTLVMQTPMFQFGHQEFCVDDTSKLMFVPMFFGYVCALVPETITEMNGTKIQRTPVGVLKKHEVCREESLPKLQHHQFQSFIHSTPAFRSIGRKMRQKRAEDKKSVVLHDVSVPFRMVNVKILDSRWLRIISS